jgi:hypothetical protein
VKTNAKLKQSHAQISKATKICQVNLFTLEFIA